MALQDLDFDMLTFVTNNQFVNYKTSSGIRLLE